MSKTSFEVSQIMTKKDQLIDKQEFIQRLYSAVSLIDDERNPSSGTKDNATNHAIDPLINSLLQHLVISSEHDPIFPSMGILLKQQLLEQDLALSAEFYKLVELIDKQFDYLVADKYLKKGVKNLISHLRIPFFKLAINDSTIFTDASHPARMLLNDMLQVGLLWSSDDLKTSPIKEQIEVIVQKIISSSKKDDIHKVFLNAEEQFKHFSDGLIKRAKIFEKRVKESEEGNARAELAKASAKEFLSKITCKKDIPFFVLNMFNKAWERVIFLDLLKDCDEEQSEALASAKQLLVSLQPISTAEELENHKALNAQLIYKLKKGLIKAAYSYNDSDKFFEQLNDHYETNLAQYQSAVTKKDSEAIIRLKPAHIIDDKNENDIDEESLAAVTTVTNEKLSQWIDNVFSELPIDSQNKVRTNSEPTKKSNSTSLETLTNLQMSSWFGLQIEQKNVRVKFCSYIQQIDKYIFVDGAGTKKAEFSSDELNRLFDEKKIEALDSSSAFERAYHLVTDELISAHLKSIQDKQEAEREKARKLEEAKRKADEYAEIEKKLEQAEQLVKVEKDKREKEAALKNSSFDFTESEPTTDLNQSTKEEHERIINNISKLAVGTRVSIEIGGEIKRCRLAAKIASSGKFIFTDQNGYKVMQCIEQELIEMIQLGQLKFRHEEDMFSESLTTVISSMRNLKSDKE